MYHISQLSLFESFLQMIQIHQLQKRSLWQESGQLFAVPGHYLGPQIHPDGMVGTLGQKKQNIGQINVGWYV